jgi:cell volume regulation protein A
LENLLQLDWLWWALIGSVLLIFAIWSSKLLYKFGVPTLLLFLGLGMFIGESGPVGIKFNDAMFANHICSIALVFIMFFGGFGMKWKKAKPVALQAGFLATFGTLLTAVTFGFAAVLILQSSILEGLLLGAIVCSTDATSTFSILRTKKLNLKGGLASLIEMESGSNDPISYLLTVTFLGLLQGNILSGWAVVWFLVQQIGVSLIVTAVFSFAAHHLFKKVHLDVEGLYFILAFAVVVACYSVTTALGGNGYLAVYILGIVIGNTKFAARRSMVHFFDGFTWLLQIIMFFILGLLVTPTHMIGYALPSVICFIVLCFLARPLSVFITLFPFWKNKGLFSKKMTLKEKAFVAFVGLQGDSSIAFAAIVLSSGLLFGEPLFNIVFFVCLLSLTIQGTLIPVVARKLNLLDDNAESVLSTFSDYPDSDKTKLLKLKLTKGDFWCGKKVADLNLPASVLIVMVWQQGKRVVPNGSTVLHQGDKLILTGSDDDELIQLSKRACAVPAIEAEQNDLQEIEVEATDNLKISEN